MKKVGKKMCNHWYVCHHKDNVIVIREKLDTWSGRVGLFQSSCSRGTCSAVTEANSLLRHLGGYCENGNFCGFQHEPKLSTAELNALRYKTRSLACKNRYCENIDCCKYKEAWTT